MRSHISTIITALLIAKFSICAPKVLCPCGYTVGDSVYTELEETDFTTIQSLLGPTAGWELQEYIIPANNSLAQPYAREMTLTNIVYSNEGVQLLVMPANNGVVSGAEIATHRSDIHYGSFRAAIRTSNVPGTCGAFFWFYNNARELDIEFLSRQLSPPVANMVIHSNESENKGFDASKTPTFYPQQLPFDPTAVFHEYRIDWSPNLVKFYVDGVLAHAMDKNIPSEPGRLFLNHWSNGSPGWSWGPPTETASMTVLYVKAYFNSSDPSRLSSAQQRCAAAKSGKPLTCAVPEELRTPGGVLPSGSAPAPASYPTTNVGLDASGTGTLFAVPPSLLPTRGLVPFLGSVPGNVEGQVAYNVTFNCSGCPSTPNGDASRIMSVGHSLWVVACGLLVVWLL